MMMSGQDQCSSLLSPLSTSPSGWTLPLETPSEQRRSRPCSFSQNPPLIEVCLVGGLTEEPEHQLMEVGGHAHKQARGSHQDAGVQE